MNVLCYVRPTVKPIPAQVRGTLTSKTSPWKQGSESQTRQQTLAFHFNGFMAVQTQLDRFKRPDTHLERCFSFTHPSLSERLGYVHKKNCGNNLVLLASDRMPYGSLCVGLHDEMEAVQILQKLQSILNKIYIYSCFHLQKLICP